MGVCDCSLHNPSLLSFRMPLIYNISGSSSIVISENLDKRVKTLHFFELPVQEKKTCIKNNLLDCLRQSKNRSTTVLMQNVFLEL